MKSIEIGIIGGTGGIGKWFADFFEGKGYKVHVSGRKTGLDIPAMAEKCDVVIVSVPIGVTCEVIKEVGPHMREETLLMDLTSLKEEPVGAMLQHSVSEVIGVHPLFGPDVNKLAGLNVVLCPARTKRWIVWLTEVLKENGANIVESTPERHDKMMSIVQGLNHLNTITMGMVLNATGTDLLELKNFATPLFKTKLDIVKRIFGNNPRLYAEIITSNPDIDTIVNIYEKILSELKGLIKEKDSEGLTEIIKERTSAGL